MGRQLPYHRIALLFFLLSVGAVFPRSSWTWNALGHRLVAQIALDQLDKPTLKRLNRLNHAMDAIYRPMSLVNASIWLDLLRKEDVDWFSPYHFISIFFTTDHSRLPSTSPVNGLKAIGMSQKLIKGQHASSFDQGLALRILLHVSGDLHQPMHTISRVSHAHPQGDMGGNLYLLANNPVALNLHGYWDRGGGYLLSAAPVNAAKVKRMAHALQKKWPCELTKANPDPHQWVEESHQLARQFAYSLPENTQPSPAYQKRVKDESMRRIALAGCRLAKILQDL
ncbi:MAG: S1/P1 nuclease [Legionellaceae bacterium]|nr:S1/P1 nuclease [Legionellaceae bacterium]